MSQHRGLSIGCPLCKAEPGQWCRDPMGRPYRIRPGNRPGLHRVRERAVQGG